MPLAACASFSPILLSRQPDASLLLPCERPQSVDPQASDNEIAAAWLDAVEKYLKCERRHADLAAFVRGP